MIELARGSERLEASRVSAESAHATVSGQPPHGHRETYGGAGEHEALE